MTKEKIQDFTLRVSNANKTGMIVVLYDIILTYIDDARTALADGDKQRFRTEITRARNSLNELIGSVNTSEELGMTLLRLYIYSSGELTKSYIYYDAENLDHVSEILVKLADAYRSIVSKDTSAPVMSNTEKLYTGYTYNPYGRTENYTDSSTKRGILA